MGVNPFVAYSFLLYLTRGVDVIVDYAALKDAHDETIIKGFAIASNGKIPVYLIRIPYSLIHNTE